MDPRVLQAAERVLAFARAQVLAGLSARLAHDSALPPADGDDGGLDGDADSPDAGPDADTALSH